MKVFISDKAEIGCISKTDYHWCDEGELLMFGLFQNDKPTDISMCGIKTRKFTTHIKVVDLNIDKEFYTELIKDSLKEAFSVDIEDDEFSVEIGFPFTFTVSQIVNELLSKASMFENGTKVKCNGRNLIEI